MDFFKNNSFCTNFKNNIDYEEITEITLSSRGRTKSEKSNSGHAKILLLCGGRVRKLFHILGTRNHHIRGSCRAVATRKGHVVSSWEQDKALSHATVRTLCCPMYVVPHIFLHYGK